MLSEGKLHRASEKLISYVNQYVQLAGVEKREEVLNMFDNILNFFPNLVVMTCPIMHPNMNFVTKNYSHIFGEGSEFSGVNKNLERIFARVHEADQEDLHACFTYLHNYLEPIPSELHFQYRAVLHYRFRKNNGQYIYLQDEKAVINLRGSGNLYYGLFRDVSYEKNFTGVKVEIFKQEEAYMKVTEFKPSLERSTLTKREGELVMLIKQGLSTKEIAWRLNISHNTVRNIKSKLFEKYQVNNTVELLNMTA